MTDQQDSPKPLDSETVAAYLRLHPEFFIDHDELIPELRIPHQRGDTVSLVERQVKLLRERNIEMRQRRISTCGQDSFAGASGLNS